MSLDRSRDRTDIAAGAVLAGAALLSLAAILHHPTLQGPHEAQAAAEAIRSLGPLDRLIHGTLMLVAFIQTVAFARVSARLGFRSAAILAGFSAYAAGSIVLVIPATLDGFVTPDLADRCLAAADCGASHAAVTELVGVAIQDFTKVALSALSLATLCWSIGIVGRPGPMPRAVGLVGLVCALAPLAALWLSDLHLRPDNLAIILSAQLVWNIAVAALMLTGAGSFPQGARGP
ncbi:MAG TPA: hypothetical protein VM689_19235 [Aliidongia sp.]|nr:hypothetical protein [Aliidongia sp.]